MTERKVTIQSLVHYFSSTMSSEMASRRPIASLVWEWPLQGGDGKANVALDARYFTSKDISVKVVGEMVEIRMEHETSGVFGGVKRSLTRCYHLPENIDPSTIKSELNKDGQLVIRGSKKAL
ncbi:unnamed protein product, partial [Mesorhabditis belari]|uniref:SHSP domain-containing protein n=1 Tax=Mesorhabditis belari TaxID=2138241 RepID=A0AAF3J561_9BILA